MIIRILRATFTIVLLVFAQPSSTVGDLVTYEIFGNAQLTHSTLGTFANESFNIVFEIEDNRADLLPGDPGRGGFDRGIARISIPNLGINNEISANVTGLVLVDTTIERFRLVDPAVLFGATALGLEWNPTGAIDDPNTIATLNPAAPLITVAWGGLAWQLGSGDTLTLLSVSNPNIQSSSRPTVVPEGSATLVLLSLVLPTLLRRRIRRRLNSDLP